MITYHTLDKISKEKEKNKRKIAEILVIDIYTQIKFTLESILTDDFVRNNIIPRIDFDAYGEHEIIINLKNDHFINESQLYNLIEDGQISQEDFLKYLKIKKDYCSYITIRIIAFDAPEIYKPMKEKLLKELSYKIV